MLLVITLCSVAAYMFLPSTQQHYILQIRKLSVLAELGIVVYAITKFRHIKRLYTGLQQQLPDTAHHLQQSIIKVLGNTLAVRLLACELTVLRFGILCWYKTAPIPANAKSFSTHRESGYAALFGVIIGVAMIEIFALHLLLIKYS